MRLDKFDLNLLVALHALLEERNVTRAAERLNLSQPAMSAALRRLREAFNDDILVAHGKKMVPTSHAQALAPQVAEAMVRMQSLVSSSTVFDSATSDRMFRIAASDYITTVLIVPLLAALEIEAPFLRIEISAPSNESMSMLAHGAIDFMVTPEQFLSQDHPKLLLFEEQHVVVGWNENPVFNTPLSDESYHSCGHIAVQISNRLSFAESLQRKMGDRRRIEVVASSFTMVPWMLPGTHRLTLMHERLAKVMQARLPLGVAPPPFTIPPMREMVQFHEARAGDGGLQWMLKRLLEQAALDPLQRTELDGSADPRRSEV
jgi:LysR family transcriptional regulator, nod-box dependent transcriptional activator